MNSGFHDLREMLIRHEGLRLKPYKCTAGKLTIGIGRCLDDVGITEEEARILLENDIQRVAAAASQNFRWFSFLNCAREDVILSMIFNLGLDGFKKFKKLISALEVSNYDLAAEEMLNSKWAEQVGYRAVELAKIMEVGAYLTFK